MYGHLKGDDKYLIVTAYRRSRRPLSTKYVRNLLLTFCTIIQQIRTQKLIYWAIPFINQQQCNFFLQVKRVFTKKRSIIIHRLCMSDIQIR